MSEPTHIAACAVTKQGPIIYVEDARPDQRYVCCECEGSMMVIKANGRADHFKHIRGPNSVPRECDPNLAAETQAIRVIMDSHGRARENGKPYPGLFHCPECGALMRSLNLAACALTQIEPAKLSLTNPRTPEIIIEATARAKPDFTPAKPEGAAHIYVYAAWESLAAMRGGLDCSRADGANMWCRRCALPISDWRDELARRAAIREPLARKAAHALAFLKKPPGKPDYQPWPHASDESLALANRASGLGFAQHASTLKPWLFSKEIAGSKLFIDMERAESARVYCYGDDQPLYKTHALEETARRMLIDLGASVKKRGGLHRDCRCEWHMAEGRHYKRSSALPAMPAPPPAPPKPPPGPKMPAPAPRETVAAA